jgi:stage V sporulation protein K
MKNDKIRVARRKLARPVTPEDFDNPYNLLLHIYFGQPFEEECTLRMRLYDSNLKMIGLQELVVNETPIHEAEFSLWSHTNWPDGTYYIHLYCDDDPYRLAEVTLDVIRENYSEATLFEFPTDDWEYYFATELAVKPWWNCMNWIHARYDYFYRRDLISFFRYESWPDPATLKKNEQARMPSYLVLGKYDDCNPLVSTLAGRNKIDWAISVGKTLRKFYLDEILKSEDKPKLWESMLGMHTVIIQINLGLYPTPPVIQDWIDFLNNVVAHKDYRRTSFIFTACKATWDLWESPCRKLIKNLDLTTFQLNEDPGHNPNGNLIPTEEEIEEARERDKERISAMDQLNELVGLTSVKAEVERARMMALFYKRREELGIGSQPDHRYHMLFLGNPGTGKTTVAKMIGKMYHEMGLLSHGEVKTVNRNDLVAEYIGQTEVKTAEVIKEARGGVLFIDEAYALADGEGSRTKDFGKEVIHALLPVLSEPNPDMLVIMAGYEDKMKMLLEMNQGLRDRFPLSLHFQDFTDGELLEMAQRLCVQKGFVLSEGARESLQKVIAQATAHRNEHFGNGRWLHNLMEQGVWKAMAMRVMACPDKSNERDLLSRIEKEDVLAAEQTWAHAECEKLVERRRIGF